MSLKLNTLSGYRRSNCVYRLLSAAAFAHHCRSVKVIAGTVIGHAVADNGGYMRRLPLD